MNVSVWDTYVQKTDGTRMHFDILVPDTITDATIVYTYGKTYLEGKSVINTTLSASECRHCHIETAPPEVVARIEKQGYDIIEMENCD